MAGQALGQVVQGAQLDRAEHAPRGLGRQAQRAELRLYLGSGLSGVHVSMGSHRARRQLVAAAVGAAQSSARC